MTKCCTLIYNTIDSTYAMRHCIRLTENEVKVLADALQFLSKSQQRNVERSHHARCDGSTSTSEKNLDDSNQSNRYDATYRKHMRGLLDDIVMEYINNDTDVTPYDFISDLKTSLYEIQDYHQGQMNRVNAILSYLNGEQSPHLFDLKSKEM